MVGVGAGGMYITQCPMSPSLALIKKQTKKFGVGGYIAQGHSDPKSNLQFFWGLRGGQLVKHAFISFAWCMISVVLVKVQGLHRINRHWNRIDIQTFHFTNNI